MHRVAPDQVQLRVVWRGGATTTSIVIVNVGSFSSMSGAKEMEETIERMAREGKSDQTIAELLTSQGHRSPMAERVLKSTVRNVANLQRHPAPAKPISSTASARLSDHSAVSKKAWRITKLDSRSYPQRDDKSREGCQSKMLPVPGYARDDCRVSVHYHRV